jgi:peptidoglycan/xylan/chitin deacetylase (PgdA/CDA1 family)
MKGRLSAIQLEYVLDHIGHHAELNDELRQLIHYGVKGDPGVPSIHFPASEAELDLDTVIRINDIPVLYPLSEDTDSFFGIEDLNLCFHHDMLKSIFHFLSGYEEVKNEVRDEYDRFPYKESLQFKLGIIGKPVVNYYMEIILKGLKQFCELNGIPFQIRSVLEGPILMLSHDIDYVEAYDFKETGFKFKQLLGLADSPFNFKGKVREAFTALYHFLNPFSKRNPFWNFDELMEWEAERGFHSSYYFLEKDGKYDNSRYKFHKKKIRLLIETLADRGHEIGIHGTMQSYDNPVAMRRTVEHLRAVSPQAVTGIRQHFLKFKPNRSAQIQAEAGLAYDASLGFSEYDGFRNSYCWPYKFFDFQKQRCMDYWEIPLNFMDVTHFYHRRLNLDQSRAAIEKLTTEVVKFNGVFSLLWHNSFFNEAEFPGITKHYTGILDHLQSQGMKGITGMEILERMKRTEVSPD